MIRFLDGPAEGTPLDLRRAPVLLRVVIDQDGTVDALDQLDDTPKDSETIYVYYRDGEVSRGFMCSRGRGGKGCQLILSADYRLHAEQPDVRATERWQEWCVAKQVIGINDATT